MCLFFFFGGGAGIRKWCAASALRSCTTASKPLTAAPSSFGGWDHIQVSRRSTGKDVAYPTWAVHPTWGGFTGPSITSPPTQVRHSTQSRWGATAPGGEAFTALPGWPRQPFRPIVHPCRVPGPPQPALWHRLVLWVRSQARNACPCRTRTRTCVACARACARVCVFRCVHARAPKAPRWRVYI